MRKLKVLDLFSGIGGFSLGLERTGGFETVAFCEIEDYPRRVLAKHWPGVPIYPDVRELTADTLRRDGITVDVICGGFPCQDLSWAGKGAGLSGERSGLWTQYARLIRELRPRYVIMENVSALLARGLGDVLGHLAKIRYDAEWHCIPASAVGACHERDRVWIVGYPNGELWFSQERRIQISKHSLADQGAFWQGANEPPFHGVAYGIPNGSHRCKAIGNAVVPQIPELIGRAILKSMEAA